MASFSVLAPPVPASGGAADSDRLIFLRDGFSWGAFLIPVLWLLYRRLWIPLAFYALFLVALELAGRQFGPLAAGSLGLLGALFLGLEGAALRRWTLARHGFVELALVEAASREEAEIRYFHDGVADGEGEPRTPSHVPAPAVASARPRFARLPSTADVVGLFPTPGTTR
jgi:hypothetical protein